HVKVAFRIDNGADFGTDTRAAIKVQTLLGEMYLALEPAGPGQLSQDSEIPTSRTSSPYDVVQAFSGLAHTSQRVNTHRLARRLPTLAALPRTHPKNFRQAPSALSALPTHLAARNEQSGPLLTNLRTVTPTLHARDDDIVGLMRDSAVLFKALDRRRQAIHNLLHSTSELS